MPDDAPRTPHDLLADGFAALWPRLSERIGRLTVIGNGSGPVTDTNDAEIARAACMMIVALQIHPQLLAADIAARTA